MPEVEECKPLRSGIWRIGRGPDPLAFSDPLKSSDLDRPDVGNRFDSPFGTYSVCYFGTTPEVCFGETLARFRPSTTLVELVKREWKDLGFMEPGAVPAEWRQRRLLTQVRLDEEAVFVNVESADTRAVLEKELASPLSFLGITNLDVHIVRGADRRVTRYISAWAYEHDYAGVRYLSKLNTEWECWGVFDHVPLEELVRNPVELTDPDLQTVAQRWGLTPH